MNIIKVIVDHLPESCNICPFSLPEQLEQNFIYFLYFCCARNVLTEEHELSIKNMVDKRPDWCPLMTHNEAFDWMFYEAKATQYIVDKLHKEFGLRKENEE